MWKQQDNVFIEQQMKNKKVKEHKINFFNKIKVFLIHIFDRKSLRPYVLRKQVGKVSYSSVFIDRKWLLESLFDIMHVYVEFHITEGNLIKLIFIVRSCSALFNGNLIFSNSEYICFAYLILTKLVWVVLCILKLNYS